MSALVDRCVHSGVEPRTGFRCTVYVPRSEILDVARGDHHVSDSTGGRVSVCTACRR